MSPTISKNSSASRRVLVILALLLFIVALVLVIVSSITPSTKKKIAFGGSSYADGYKVAREQAYRSGLAKMMSSSVTGIVESVSSDSIKIKTNLFVDERVDGVGQVRTIKVDQSAKIEKQIQKDQKAFAEEQSAYMEKMKNFDPEKDKAMMSPLPYETKALKLSDLKQGDMVTIMAGEGEDLTLVEPIQAKSIQMTTPTVLPGTPAVPATAPTDTPTKQ